MRIMSKTAPARFAQRHGFLMIAGVTTLFLSVGSAAIGQSKSTPPVKTIPKASPIAEALPSIYRGDASNLYINAYRQNALESHHSKDIFLLFADGQVRRKMPPAGLDTFDKAKDKAEEAAPWGTYRIAGDKITFRWSGSPTEFNGAFAKGGFTYQSNPYVKLPAVESAKIEGTFRRADGKDGDPTITFRLDGTFHERGIVGPHIGLDDFTVPGAGTYKIRSHTLSLVYSDGRKRELSYLIPKSEAGKDKPAQIVIHSYDLARMAETEAPDLTPCGTVLVKGDPPLTQIMADVVMAHYEWIIDVKFTPAQRAKVQGYLVEYWTTKNDKEIKNTLDTIIQKKRLDKATQFVRDTLRENTQENGIPQWRKATDDPLSLYLAAIYDETHKP